MTNTMVYRVEFINGQSYQHTPTFHKGLFGSLNAAVLSIPVWAKPIPVDDVWKTHGVVAIYGADGINFYIYKEQVDSFKYN